MKGPSLGTTPMNYYSPKETAKITNKHVGDEITVNSMTALTVNAEIAESENTTDGAGMAISTFEEESSSYSNTQPSSEQTNKIQNNWNNR